MRYYLGEDPSGYQLEVEATKPRPAPRPAVVKPLPVERAPVPPPIPYQTQMETPYGIVQAPRGTKVVGTFATSDRSAELESQAVQAKLEESYKPEFSLPSKLVKPGEKAHAGVVPSLVAPSQAKPPSMAQVKPAYTWVVGEEQKKLLAIARETQLARGLAQEEAKRQYAKGRGGGSSIGACNLPWKGSCTDEAYAIYQAIKAGGPYEHIGFSQVRRQGHSAVAVYPKGRGNKYDDKMIVFDPYKSYWGDYWHEEKASSWQGGIFGMWKYSGSDYSREDRTP